MWKKAAAKTVVWITAVIVTLTVTVGAAVKAGDAIGTVGETAMVEIAEEPHLHVEMTVGGLQADPTEYLSEDAMATLREDTNYEDAS